MIRIITTIVGDLFLAPENIIGHQVNCMGKMNSGVAKSVREKYPEAYLAYMGNLKSGNPLGKCQLVQVSDNRFVANLFGQLNYGYDGKQYTNYDALKKSLQSLYSYAKENNLSVALPYKIGCDRGGGDWGTVYRMIDEVFHDYSITLYYKA